MADDENIAQELHGHLTQMLRTSLSGGLQMREVRARRHHQEAEAERRLAAEAARQLEERKRAERELHALVAQQALARQEAEREVEAGRSTEPETPPELEHLLAESVPMEVEGIEPNRSTATTIDLDPDLDLDVELGVDQALDVDQALASTGRGR